VHRATSHLRLVVVRYQSARECCAVSVRLPLLSELRQTAPFGDFEPVLPDESGKRALDRREVQSAVSREARRARIHIPSRVPVHVARRDVANEMFCRRRLQLSARVTHSATPRVDSQSTGRGHVRVPVVHRDSRTSRCTAASTTAGSRIAGTTPLRRGRFASQAIRCVVDSFARGSSPSEGDRRYVCCRRRGAATPTSRCPEGRSEARDQHGKRAGHHRGISGRRSPSARHSTDRRAGAA
jgi:hypothetical protein